MIIPGFVISVMTFPGVIIHELAHQLFCMICGLEVYEVKYFQMNIDYSNPLNLILGWLGIFILMHFFPSTGDAKVMVARILKNPDVSILWKVLAAPFIGIIYVFSIGSMFWLDLIYAMAMGLLLPELLVRIL